MDKYSHMINKESLDALMAIPFQTTFDPTPIQNSLINWYFDNFRKQMRARMNAVEGQDKKEEQVGIYLKELRINVMIQAENTLEAQFKKECYTRAVDRMHDELL